MNDPSTSLLEGLATEDTFQFLPAQVWEMLGQSQVLSSQELGQVILIIGLEEVSALFAALVFYREGLEQLNLEMFRGQVTQ